MIVQVDSGIHGWMASPLWVPYFQQTLIETTHLVKAREEMIPRGTLVLGEIAKKPEKTGVDMAWRNMAPVFK